MNNSWDTLKTAWNDRLSRALDWVDKEKVQILFLAKYAPQSIKSTPSFHPTDGIYPIYHHDIYCALKEFGFQVLPFRDSSVLIKHASKHRVYVFTLLNRAPYKGSEIFISSLCEYKKLPYLGASPHIRGVAEDKHLAKILARTLKIPTPCWQVIREGDEPLPPTFRGPYIIKPRYGAASAGISMDSIYEVWKDSISKIKEFTENGGDVILEKFIPGYSVTIPLIGGTPPLLLPPTMTDSELSGGIETYEQKRLVQTGTSKRHLLNNFGKDDIYSKSALKIWDAIRPIDYFRADFRLDKETNKSYFLEFNVCCNLGRHSTIAKPASELGISQKDLLAIILDYSFRRQNVIG